MIPISPHARIGKDGEDAQTNALSELPRNDGPWARAGRTPEVARNNIATPVRYRPSWTRLRNRTVRRRIVQWLLRRALPEVGTLTGVGKLVGVAIHRILVLRPNHRLGNILLLTPLLAELERIFPGAEIDVLIAGNSAGELLDLLPSVHQVHALPQYLVRHPARTIAMLARLRRMRYDLAVDASPNSHSSRLALAVMSSRYGIGAPERGDATWSRLMLSAPSHFAKLPVFLVRRALGLECDIDATPYPPLTVRLTPLERAMGREIFECLTRSQDCIPFRTTLGVFANATGAKCYAESWWLEFLAAITAALPSCSVIEFVPADGSSRLGNRFLTYYSTNVRKLASVISNLTCFVSGDCGVMHLASASGVPTIGLFSASDPSRYEPYGEVNCSLQTADKTPQEIADIAIEKLRCVVQLKR